MTLLEKIKSRGYWRVVIRPKQFVDKQVEDISALFPIIQKTSVELRGWDFPHVDTHIRPHIDVDWVGQEAEWEQFLEIWRFYQSGQFVDFAGIPEDWYEQSTWLREDPRWETGKFLGIGNALFRFTEIFEFAARLALTEAGDELMHVEITINGLTGRKLFSDLQNRAPMFRNYEASLQGLPFKTELSRDELVAHPSELAIKPAIELFARFGWTPNETLLRDIQKDLRTV